jgi:3alpha(or 20beta)-hydroxysteroid dehydrogenase
MGRLDGKVAIVTGAARGTGAEIARLFDSEGASTTLVDVLDDRGEAVAKKLGDCARYRHLDVTSEREWRETVDEIRKREGHIDVLVNNAAVLHLATIDMTTVDAWERVLRVNCLGPFLGVRTVLPAMRASGGGSIVNIGSIDSVTGTSLTSAYTTSKFGLRGFTKVIALENKRFGIRANVVCPAAGNPEMHPPIVGWEETQRSPGRTAGRAERSRPDQEDLQRPTYEDPERVNRGPSAVAPAVLYFASDESRLCNGTELVLDGAGSAGIHVELPDRLYVTLEA